jgi:hypothetical protein
MESAWLSDQSDFITHKLPSPIVMACIPKLISVIKFGVQVNQTKESLPHDQMNPH